MRILDVFRKKPSRAQGLGRPERTAQRSSHDKDLRFRPKPGRVRTESLPEVEPWRSTSSKMDGPGVAQVPVVHYSK